MKTILIIGFVALMFWVVMATSEKKKTPAWYLPVLGITVVGLLLVEVLL